MENCFSKVTFLLYDDVMVGKYEILYNDKDIPFIDYVDLREQLSKLNKEMFRIVMRS